MQATAELIAPEKALLCAPDDDPCEITLNVTLMHTMTLYEHLGDGQRASEGYPAAWDVGMEPAQLQMADDSPLPSSAVPQFLYPVVGDGMENREVFAVNNQVPGPVIVGYKGQNIRIRVINNLPNYNITIHWHGQHVRGTPWVDGVVFVTQCPIEPGKDLVYSFSLDQVGTHLYHAHNAGERSDGIHGGLVVKDTQTTVSSLVDIPEEHTMIVTDWYHDTWDVLLDMFQKDTFLDPVNSSVIYSPTPITDGTLSSHYPFVSGLINGVGRLFYPHASNCTPQMKVPLQEFNVIAGNEYRFRMIGVQSWFTLRLSIQGHRLRVIATDGVDVTTAHIAEEVDYIIINSGERFDFVPVPMEANPTGKYWIVMETLETADELEARYYCIAGHRAYAILTYNGSTVSGDPSMPYDPLNRGCTMANRCYAVNCPFASYPHSYNTTCLNVEELRLVEPETVTDNPSDTDLLFLNFQVVGGHFDRNAINGRHYLTPQLPLLAWNTSNNFTCDAPTAHKHEARGKECLHRYVFQSSATDMVFMALGNSADGGGGHGHGATQTGGHNTGGHNTGGHGDGSTLHLHGHPVHLHGYYFRVLKVGYPTYMHGTYSADNMDVNCSVDPFCEKGARWEVQPNVTLEETLPKKDTVFVPAGGYVVVRVVRNNPGIWQLHCHITPHQVQGMTMIIDESELFDRSNIPSSWPLCGLSLGSAGSSDVFYSLLIMVMGVVAAFFFNA